MTMDSTSLPSELLVTPQPLIGLCGLDIGKNSVHKSIWDAFNNNRKPNSTSVQYKLLQTNYEFPVSKPKRPSYDWYHPKGILKRNWMLKHLHVLPAVIVLFQDIEWNDPQWLDKQVQCALIIQSFKNSISQRNIRLSLVLIQKSAPAPPGEDLLASERAASLATACGISSKMLFILPHTDDLSGYASRLESAFLEMAQQYYSQMIKHIRSHRDQLNSDHIVLKIRHQFKLGFITEIRNDNDISLKHYSQAYSILDEVRIVDTNCLEIKTLAGFLNYKICRLMFKLKIPRDSITHFISHIEKYKSRVGFKELLFEHYAWLSTQHSAFGELFCKAINNDLPALQTQHPGIYFHKAAEYIVKRKEAFIQSCSLALTPTEPNSPSLNSKTNSMFSEFFGIRNVKPGEPYSDQQIISLVQDNERNFNHSAAIIHLLGQARIQFKTYRCIRFCKKLSIDMAEEYFKCGDYANALTLYSLMLSDYRQEKWNSIFSDVLLKTLRCAFLSASVVDFISCSLEALSPTINYNQKDRIIVLENLWKVFQSTPPVPQTQTAPELRSRWVTSLSTLKSPIKIDLDRITEIIEGFISFEKSQIKVDDEVNISFTIKTLTDVPFKIAEINILLSDNTETFKLKALKYCIFNNLMEIRHEDFNDTKKKYILLDSDILLEPDKYYKIIFTADSNTFLENTQLQVSKIHIHIGTTNKNYAILMKKVNFSKPLFQNYDKFKKLIDNIQLNSVCCILPTFHLHTETEFNTQPMLVNEYFKVTCNIRNTFNIVLQNVGINITIPNQFKNKVFLSTDITPTRQKLLPSIQIDIGDMQSNTNTKISFYVFSLIESGAIELNQTIWYHLETSPRIKRIKSLTDSSPNDDSPTNNMNVNNSIMQPSNNDNLCKLNATNIRIDYIDEKRVMKSKDEIITLICVPELKFYGRYYSLNRQPLQKIYRGENFLFRANIEIQSPIDLDILETYFICDHNLVQSTYSSKRKKLTYKKNQTLEDVFVLRTNSSLHNWITFKEFESNKNHHMNIFHNKKTDKIHKFKTDLNINHQNDSAAAAGASTPVTNLFNKNLLSKIPTNATIIGNIGGGGNLSINQNTSITTNNSSHTDDNKNIHKNNEELNDTTKMTPRLVFHKAMDTFHPTGHLRGFIKGYLVNDITNNLPIFGIYCIKWRRTNTQIENESKFIINGLDIDEPPLNIYSSIEQKMFVKIPMPLKIIFKNPTSKVIHLIASLNNTENFMCAGHKQLNISVFAYTEKELVFILYPLKVGWQNLPELNLDYNTQADPSKDEIQKKILFQIAQRSMPQKVFILPASKQLKQ